MDWSDSWRDSFRIELRAEAVGLAWRGWPIVPGTYPSEGAWTDGLRHRGDGPSPVREDWQDRLDTAPEEVASWWTGRPYSLLVATGKNLDAIEVSDTVGKRTAAMLRAVGIVVPIAATPEGRWLFLTQPARRDRTELCGGADVQVHGKGSWIPIPPSLYGHGIVHWRVKPQVCGWQLASAEVVQDAVAKVLGSVPTSRVDELLSTQRLSA
jgi:hypothetical protein